jgi:predicted Zn-dependent protease
MDDEFRTNGCSSLAIGIGVAAALTLATAGCAPATNERPDAKLPTASVSPFHDAVRVWELDHLANEPKPYLISDGNDGIPVFAGSAELRLIDAVANRIVAASGSGEKPELLLYGTGEINAFAFYQAERPAVGITFGMIGLLGDDEGAWGALYGHELAHIRLHHFQEQQARSRVVEIGGNIAGFLLSLAGVGFGSIVSDASTPLIERAFSRSDESEADRVGMDYERRAGLDPAGALRLQEKLLSVGSASGFSFLSTHPSGKERIAAIRALLHESESQPTTK